METTQENNRKILLFLPILVLPFLALAFYAMGGGKENTNSKLLAQQGINAHLPDANFKHDDPTNKMGFYQQSDRDSADNGNGIKNVIDRLGFNNQEDPQTEQINQKLEALNKEINRPVEISANRYSSTPTNTQASSMGSDVDRLENLMKIMKENKNEDPEMVQLNGMLQNILDIQHPTRVQQRISQTQNLNMDSLFQAIPAIIVSNQKAIQGATIKIRLQDSIRINGVLIPKDHDLFGICRITNQRLLLDIKNIRLGTSIIPVDLSVYSLDGMVGINAPEALLADAVNDGANDAVRNIQLMGIDQSLGVQAAGAGIEAAKSLFSKKVKRVKVKLEAGKPILLRNNNKTNQSLR